ncbi:MAG: hypothetical protein IJJ58_05630, partial [Campylobacter sp.]|nr:hypothetical protein [Campylobacter sp.]
KQLYKCKDCLKRFIIKQDKAKRLYYDYLDLKISRLSVIYGLSDNKTEIYILVFFLLKIIKIDKIHVKF